MKITLLSDTHNKHKQVSNDLPGGDLIIHTGDISSRGYENEIQSFLDWYKKTDYSKRIFCAGNHDWGFANNIEKTQVLLEECKDEVDYLQDGYVLFERNGEKAKIYGSPWQPEFYAWAFNLPRNGDELKETWSKIPLDTDILMTHGPAWGILDDVEGRRGQHLGCELLIERIKEIKCKIHICGHIHSGHGYYFDGNTHFFNASVLNEQYQYAYKPFVFDWNPETNEITWN